MRRGGETLATLSQLPSQQSSAWIFRRRSYVLQMRDETDPAGALGKLKINFQNCQNKIKRFRNQFHFNRTGDCGHLFPRHLQHICWVVFTGCSDCFITFYEIVLQQQRCKQHNIISSPSPPPPPHPPPRQECENIHPSLSSPTTEENLWSKVTTTAALKIGNLNTSPGIHPYLQYIYIYSFYQYQPQEMSSWGTGEKVADIFYWFDYFYSDACVSQCLEQARRSYLFPWDIFCVRLSSPAPGWPSPLSVQPPACLTVPPVSRGQLWAKFEVNWELN